jgi:hypothetical protein
LTSTQSKVVVDLAELGLAVVVVMAEHTPATVVVPVV